MQDLFVAGAFTFFHQSPAQPPHQGMKPENGFHQHVKGGGKIVATADMPDFVGQNGFEVSVFQTIRNSFRPDEHRTRNAKDARLKRTAREKKRNTPANSTCLFKPAQRIHFPAFLNWHGCAHGDEIRRQRASQVIEDSHKSAEPNGGKNRGKHLREVR